jgi:DNA-binding transcriptional LysR family regulator
MIMARKPLPLQQINSFEAAARHLSFSRAAQELNVQQPAISRQVAALEGWLGIALFTRSKPRLTLTEEGHVLASTIANGFDAMYAGFEAVQSRRPGGEIVVNAAIGFTSFYLLPRLAEFQSLHPNIKVQVVTRDQNPDYELSRRDLVVVFGE